MYGQIKTIIGGEGGRHILRNEPRQSSNVCNFYCTPVLYSEDLMASIVPHGSAWRAHIKVGPHRESKVFRTAREAHAWAANREKTLELTSWTPPDIRVMTMHELRSLSRVTENVTVSGVYFLWSPSRLVYIGQSKNIARRVATHKIKPPAPFDWATFLHVPHPWQLAVEQLYIDEYLPVMVMRTDSRPLVISPEVEAAVAAREVTAV